MVKSKKKNKGSSEQGLRKINVANGVYWVEAPQADLYILCGCPADSVKHLLKLALIVPIEKDGFTFETGPNAILLSDQLIQNGYFSNLSEFPVLQMLYRQGLILPHHPNNTGVKPLLIGSKEQVTAQKEYIYRGNYGLISEKELMEAGLSQEMAKTFMRLKLKFAFGNIKKTDELLDSLIVQDQPVEIRNEVFVSRTAPNVFEFQHKEEKVKVDLNLDKDETYVPSYSLGDHQVQREYFAVIHSGEGDGWDINRPCTGSVLMFQKKIYLIDASMDVLKEMITDDDQKEGISREYFESIKNKYLERADLKKIDIGGGFIHGNALDFYQDTSPKILLVHSAAPLTKQDKAIGSNATFGETDVLIETNRDYLKIKAEQYLDNLFPDWRFRTKPATDSVPNRPPL